MENDKLGKFIIKFDLEKHGFIDVTPFSDGSLGFSARKSFKKNDNNATQLSVYIYSESSDSINSNKKPLIIHATYGVIVDGGIRIRSNPKLDDPVDLESRDTYYYNIESEEFYKKNKNIIAGKIVDEIYNNHIKSTKLFKGFWLRLKIFFWRFFLRLFFEYISKIFYFLLYIISGDKYSYEPFFEEETLNGKIIKSRLRPPVENPRGEEKLKEGLKESARIDFFNHKVRHWPIVFYSILHGSLYIVLMLKNYKPIVITTIFKNNFLTIIYVILSLWVIETVMPKGLIFLIKSFSRLSFLSQHRSISI